MPRRIKPRLGWRYPSFLPGVADDQIRSIYSPAFGAEVANEFEIPSAAHDRLSKAMLNAGAFYKQSKATGRGRPMPTGVQEHFELIAHHASILLAVLDDLDDVSTGFYKRTEMTIQEECVFRRISTTMLEIGALRLVNEERDEWEFYTSADLFPVLKLVELIARRAQADLPASTHGLLEKPVADASVM
jgi:hypothetical protein